MLSEPSGEASPRKTTEMQTKSSQAQDAKERKEQVKDANGPGTGSKK